MVQFITDQFKVLCLVHQALGAATEQQREGLKISQANRFYMRICSIEL